MIKWMQNIDREILFQHWENIWMKGIKFIVCLALREKCFPARLCYWKCKEVVGTFYYMWGKCKTMRKNWTEIQAEIRRILNIKFPSEFRDNVMIPKAVEKNITRFVQIYVNCSKCAVYIFLGIRRLPNERVLA